jgi:hypothetical protein
MIAIATDKAPTSGCLFSDKCAVALRTEARMPPSRPLICFFVQICCVFSFYCTIALNPEARITADVRLSVIMLR